MIENVEAFFGTRRWPPASELFGSHMNGRGLWIGSGPSGKMALEGSAADYDAHYDFVIVPNKGYVPVTALAGACGRTKWYSLQVEATIVRFDWFWDIPTPPFTLILEHNNLVHLARESYPMPDRPRCSNLFNAYLVCRSWYPDAKHPGPLKPAYFDPRRYFTRDAIYGDNIPRLLKGPPDDEINHSRGTNLLQSIHLAGLLGARRLDIIGCELCFPQGQRHYFETNDEQEPIDPDYITEVEIDGERAQTHRHFSTSAEYIENIVPLLRPHALDVVKCFDGGLLRNIPTGELAWNERHEKQRAS